jgi:hypothetical protein
LYEALGYVRDTEFITYSLELGVPPDSAPTHA